MKLIYLYDSPNTVITVKPFVNLLTEFCDVEVIDWCNDNIPHGEIPIVYWTNYVMEKIQHLEEINILGVGTGGVIASRLHYLLKDKINKIILVNCGLPYKDGLEDFLHGKTIEYWLDSIDVTPDDLKEENISFQKMAGYMTKSYCDIKHVLKTICFKDIPSNYFEYKVSKLLPYQIDKDVDLSDKGRESVLSYKKCFFIFSEEDYLMKFSKVDAIDWLQMKKRYYIRHDWRRWVRKIPNSRHLIEYDQPELFSSTIKEILYDVEEYEVKDPKPKSWKTKWEK